MSSHSDVYNHNQEPKTRFTGIFIPVEILNIVDLTPTDIILLSWIDALYCKDHGGCYAKNDYLGKKLHLKEKSVSEIISKLMKIGLVEKVGFDGRTRVIRACKEKWYQPESASGLNRSLHPVKTGGRGRSEPESHNIYIKEERKDKDIARTASQPRFDILFSFEDSSFKNITDKDILDWKELYPSVDVDLQIKKMIQWNLSNSKQAKSKKQWRKFINTWLSKNNEELINKKSYQSAKKGGESNEKENYDLCKRIVSGYESPTYSLNLLSKELEFTPKGNGQPICLSYSELGFNEQLQNNLRKCAFVKKKNVRYSANGAVIED